MLHTASHLRLRNRAGRKRSAPITLPTPFTLERFEEAGVTLEIVTEVDARKRPTGLVYNRITPQIDTFLRQGKLSSLAHEALTRFVLLTDKVHLASSCVGVPYEPREYEAGMPAPGARIEWATDTIQHLVRIRGGLSAHWEPFLSWVAPMGQALPWRKQVRLWQPTLSRAMQETWFFRSLEELGLILAERLRLVSPTRR